MELECHHGIKCKMTFDNREEDRSSSNRCTDSKSFCDLIKDPDVVRGTKNDWLGDEDFDSSQDIFYTSDSEESETSNSTLRNRDSGTESTDGDLVTIEASQPEILSGCHDEEFILSQKSNQSDSLLNDLYPSTVKLAPKTTQHLGWSPIASYKSVSTPKRIKISLGANYSSNSDLEWSVSMQTPLKLVNANGISITESDTIKMYDETPVKYPKTSPNTKDLEKIIRPNAEVLRTSEHNKTPAEDINHPISTLGLESPKDLGKTYTMKEPIPIPIQKCDNISSFILRVGLNEKTDTNELSLSEFFSGSISPTILDEICQVSEVYDKLSDCCFSDDEIDFEPATGCLTASTPVLNKKFYSNKLTTRTPLSPVAKMNFSDPPSPDNTETKSSKVKVDVTTPKTGSKCKPMTTNSTPKQDSIFKGKKPAKFLYPTSSQILRTSRKSPCGLRKITFDPGLPSIIEVPSESSSNQFPSDTQVFDDFPVTQSTLKELSNLMEIVESVHACKSSVDKGSGYTQFDDLSPEGLFCEKTPLAIPKQLKSMIIRTPMMEKVKNPGLSKRLFNTEADNSELGNNDHFKTASGKDLPPILNEVDAVKKTFELDTSITMDMFEGDFDYCSEPPEVLINDEMDDVKMDDATNTNEITTLKANYGKFPCFSTGSGKPIQVSDEALKKAKTLLDNDHNPSSSDTSISTHLNPNTTSKSLGFSTGSSNIIKPSDEALKKDYQIDDIPSVPEVFYTNESSTSKGHSQIETQKFMGFSTGSGKTIKVSDEAFKKAKVRLEKITSEPDMFEPNKPSTSKETGQNETPKFSGFSTGSGKFIKVSDKALKKAKSLWDDIPSEPEMFYPNKPSTSKESALNEVPMFMGFSTGSGKTIKVSDVALKEAKSRMDEVSSGTEVLDPKNLPTCQESSLNQAPKFMGFSTGLGKTIKFSDEALKKAKSLWDDIPSESEMLYSNKPSTSKESVLNQVPMFIGFSTGSGKTIKVSDVALKEAKSRMDEIPSGAEVFDPKNVPTCKESSLNQAPKFMGFNTGLGKTIKVSDEALKKAKSFLSDTDNTFGSKNNIVVAKPLISMEHHQKETPKFMGFNTGSGKIIKDSDEALNKAKLLLNEESALLSSTFNDPKSYPIIPKFVGFSTGSGKTIKVSEEALIKAKSHLDEVLTEAVHESFGFKTPLEADTNTSKICKGSMVDSPQPGSNKFLDQQVPTFLGLTTCLGKKVTLSDQSLQKARSFLSDEVTNDSGIGASISSSRNSTIGGFSSASGKKVQDCEKSLILAKENLSKNDAIPQSSTAGCENNILVSATNTHELNILPKSIDEGKYDNIGFKIDTDKTVSVSETTLNMGKSLLLEDIILTKGEACLNPLSFGGFSTGSGNTIKVSDEALSKAKKLLISVEEKVEVRQPEEMKKLSNSLKPTFPSPATRPIGKSQFQSKLNSFSTPFRLPRMVGNSAKREYPNNSKLETQPDAKRAKISDKILVKGNATENNMTTEKINNNVKMIKPGMLWNSKYENLQPRIKLKDYGREVKSYSKEELLGLGIDPKTLDINGTNSEDYTFEKIGEANSIVVVGDKVSVRLSPSGSAGKEEILKGFMTLPSVDSTLISEKWIFNHYRWIVWKLAAMEIFFPDKLAKKYLTLDNVLYQLKLRYDREIDNSQRCSLKKIMERDDTPAKTMILCVASISTKTIKSGDFSETITTLELTDGWYSIPSIIDSALIRMVENGRVKVGQKLIIHGAELVGSAEAYDPLDAPSHVALKISANSTRRARWYCKLGFQPRPQPFSIPLSSVLNDGGIVSQITCIIARIYPIQYLERFPDGHTISRGESSEKKISMRHEKMRQEYIEELVCKIQTEMEGKENTNVSNFNKTRRKDSVGKIQALTTGVELYEAMESYPDLMSFKELLSETQVQMLEEYLRQRQESKQSHMRSMISSEISKLEDSSKFPKNRVVVPLLRVRLLNLSKNDEKPDFSCILTIWRPDDNLCETLKEGDAYSIFQLVPRSSKNSNYELQLNSTKKTRYQKINCVNFNHTFVPRMLTPFFKFRSKHFSSAFSEADIVGFIFQIERRSTNGDVEKIFLVDHRNVVIQIIFLANPQLICGEDVLKEGNFVAVTNLKMQSQNLVLYATEVTNITCHPKKVYLQEGLKALKNNILDPKSFVEITLEKFNRSKEPKPLSTPGNDKTPIRLQYPVYSPSCIQMNSSFNHSFVSRQPKTNRIPNDGLLIKSPLHVEPNSPADLVSKRTKEKISLLERYGEPSPIDLPCLVSPVSGRVRKPFKVPILKKD